MIYCVAAFVLFVVYAHFQYTSSVQAWFWLVGPAIGVIGHVLWADWVSRSKDPTEIYMNGFWYWQVAVQLGIIVAPAFLYEVRLQPLAWAGLVLVVAGVSCFYFGSGS